MKTQKRKSIFAWIVVVLYLLFSAFYGLAWAGYLPVPAFFTIKRPAPTPKPAETRHTYLLLFENSLQ